MTKSKLVCSGCSVCLMLLVLSVGPALGQQGGTEANELNQRVIKLHQIGKYAEAIPLARRVLGLREQALGPTHPDVAASLNNLAFLLNVMGDYAGARPLYERALKINEQAYGPTHPTIATNLNNLAELLRITGDYAGARPLYDRALRIREQALGPTHPDVARSLNNLAALLRDTGNNAGARPLYERALKINERALGPTHPDVAVSLDNLAELLQAMGDYAGARPLMEGALRIREQALGPTHLDMAQSLNNLGKLLQAMGDYAGARPLYERALWIHVKVLGPTHPTVAVSLNNLAVLLRDTGDSAGARPLYERALKINEHALGPTHPDVALSLNNLAVLLRDTGDSAGARSLMERALTIRERALGPTHPDVAHSLNNLAELLRTTGDSAGARPLYERALKINEHALGPTHPDVALSLNNLAVLLRDTGDSAGARLLMERALTIRERALGPTHPDVAHSLNNLAELLWRTGDSAGARPLYEQALRITEQALGPTHLDVAHILDNLSGLEAAQGRFGLAAGFLRRGLLIEDLHIQNVFNITTEAEKLTFIESLSANYLAYLSMLHQHLNADTDALRDGLELVLRRKGVVFDAQSRIREALKGHLSETARKDFDQLSALRSELAHFFRKKPETMSADIYNDKLKSLQQEIEATERRLASESALVAKELQHRTITVERGAKQLPKNGVLAEFVKIHDYDFAKGKWKSSSRYLAFILTAVGNVTLVDLGEADALERQADRTLEDIKVALMTRRKDHLLKSQESLAQLSALVWTPLASSLGQADTLIVSPDGQLNLVPFAALVEGTGQPLVERYHLIYVSSGRELLTTGAAFAPETELLLVANPAYDQTVADASSPGTTLRSRDFLGHFDPLPGTEREAHEIPPLVAGLAAQKRVLVGPGATERVVKAAHSPRILHLATHGFFLQDKLIPIETSLRGVRIEMGSPLAARPRDQPLPQRYENPLLRSGLAFAGANHAGGSPGGEDGILTALEITGMDLNGTDLVVLSACETALGTVRTGEGVFGLRRAFALAGAKNLLMSLWSVDDEVTADQMKAFYQNLRTLPPADALRQAQRETIHRLKERDGAANPGLWAPFILQGTNVFGSVHSIADSK